MPDPFMVWLSHVDQLLQLDASISKSLATIISSAGIMLASLLGMYICVLKFRLELKAISNVRQQPVQKTIAEKRKSRRRSAST